MTADEFLNADEPPTGYSPALLGLWYAERGDWEAAHVAVQDDGSDDASWVHACLHREEGDLGNAAYWYSRAGRAVADGSLAEERRAIAAVLLENLG